MTCRELFSMAVGRQRHDRLMAVHQAQLVWALFSDETKLDLSEYVKRGQMTNLAAMPMPFVPGVDEAVAAIVANGGKLIIPKE